MLVQQFQVQVLCQPVYVSLTFGNNWIGATGTGMHPTHKGLWAVHSAVFLFGLTALFSKLIALPALEITLLRSLFAVVALWAVIRWQGEPVRLQVRRDYATVLLLGVLLAGHWVTYFHAMQVSSIAVGVIALYTFPVMTVFLEPLFHGDRPHWVDVISGVGVVFGIYLLVPEFRLDAATTQGGIVGHAFGAAVCLA